MYSTPLLPQLFVQAVGEANHLTLTPLVLPKSVMDELLGYGTVQKAASTDLDAPAQLVASASSDHTNSPDLPSLKGEPSLPEVHHTVAVRDCTHSPALLLSGGELSCPGLLVLSVC